MNRIDHIDVGTQSPCDYGNHDLCYFIVTGMQDNDLSLVFSFCRSSRV